MFKLCLISTVVELPAKQLSPDVFPLLYLAFACIGPTRTI